MINFIPTHCEYCGHKLAVTKGKNNKYKLICQNDECEGVALKKFQSGMLAFEISGLGPATFEKLYETGIRDIYDLLVASKEQLINSGQFKDGRALDKMMESISSVKAIDLDKLIISLQFNGVGKTISKEIANYYNGESYNFDGFDYSIRDEITNPESKLNVKIKEMVDKLSSLSNVDLITKQTNEMVDDKDVIIIEMTGSPKSFGFNTKNDFLDMLSPFGVVHGKLNANCNYLVTDDLSSTTGKMAKVIKLQEKGCNVKVVTYGQLVDILKS